MTIDPLDHDTLREQVALYAIGALSAAERAQVDAHLRDCEECTAELRSYRRVNAALAQVVPQHDPSPAVRTRVLDAARRSTDGRAVRPSAQRATWLPWLAAAAMLVVTLGLGYYVMELQERLQFLEGQLRDALLRVDEGERRVNVALRAAAAAEAPLSVLTAPDLRRIDLAGQAGAPQATARAFWSRTRGLVFTGSDLPPVPAGRTYQLWFIAGGVPTSGGVMTRPDANGRMTTVVSPPANVPNPDALAVTIEPDGGVPAPTSNPFLIGRVSTQ
jgi:anti-sigma-K factor RskA